MSSDILYLDRITKEIQTEKVFGKAFLEASYGEGITPFFLPLIAKYSFASRLYGAFQNTSFSKKKIKPFIEEFQVDPSEFLQKPDAFSSFNDFFVRKLLPSARPIAPGRDVAILPADGRYLVYPNIEEADGFVVKGKKFSLEELLVNKELADSYARGSMVIARLCPTDYHRFHFPCSCVPSVSNLLQGSLYSVNPLALRKKIEILSQNKREITFLQTANFGRVLFIEVGATFVGSIHQTYCPNEPYAKGDEKGYFSFGGSTLILLFEPDTIQFDQDLIDASFSKLEVKGLMGQSLGTSLNL